MADTNTPPANKDELLERMRTGRASWDALVAHVPESVVAEPVLPNGWSVKDLVAHVAACEKWTAAQIVAMTEGRVPTDMELFGVESLPAGSRSWDTDSINAMIHDHSKDADIADVVLLADRSFQELVAAVEAAPDEVLANPGSWTNGESVLELVPGETYAHYEQHVDDLRSISGEDVY